VHGDLSSSRVFTAVKQRLLQVLVINVLADKHHLTDALLSLRKRLVTGAEVDLLVHTLEHKLNISLVGKGKHALSAVQISSLGLQQGAHEGVEQGNIQQPRDGEAHRGYQGQVVGSLFLLLGGTVVVIMVVIVLVLVGVWTHKNNVRERRRLKIFDRYFLVRILPWCSWW
jgi:hypothetical protein